MVAGLVFVLLDRTSQIRQKEKQIRSVPIRLTPDKEGISSGLSGSERK
jgi:hypothetical protein